MIQDIIQYKLAGQCDDSLWSPLLLHTLMPVGTNEHLKPSALHLGGTISAPRGEVRGIIQDGFDLVPLPSFRHGLQAVQFRPDLRAGLPQQLLKSAGLAGLRATTPAHRSKGQGAV